MAWILQHQPLQVRARNRDDTGYDVGSDYVELFWLPVIGPTSLCVLRRLVKWCTVEPDGFECDLAELSELVGLGRCAGHLRRDTGIVRTVSRLCVFGVARVERDHLTLPLTMPPLPAHRVKRLPDTLVPLHREHEWERINGG